MLQINLSLVSHTNVGKTTLARTLLGRDIGEVRDASHVTTSPESYVLAETQNGSLVLWDTPGFGDSVRLASRLEGRSSLIGKFVSEVYDRFTSKVLWLNQQILLHVKGTSDVIFYLVNASEHPGEIPYLESEMRILKWLGKPVIVLLNQLGEVRTPEAENADIDAWKKALAEFPDIRAVLPMDAFTRCWVQEFCLWDEMAKTVPEEKKAVFDETVSRWKAEKTAAYDASVEALAVYLSALGRDREELPHQSIFSKVVEFGKSLGIGKKDEKKPGEAEMKLASRAADHFRVLSQKLIRINGLEGDGVQEEILTRLTPESWERTERASPETGALIGAIAMGAASGLAADLMAGGLTLGTGTLAGAVAGAIGGGSVTEAYNVYKGTKENAVSWSPNALRDFMLYSLLLYLAVAHYGRGRGRWEKIEYPEFWSEDAEAELKKLDTGLFAGITAEKRVSVRMLSEGYDSALRGIFKKHYGIEF